MSSVRLLQHRAQRKLIQLKGLLDLRMMNVKMTVQCLAVVEPYFVNCQIVKS